MTDKEYGEEKEMSFFEHLDELRSHLIRIVIGILAVSIFFLVRGDILFNTILFGPKNSDFLTYKLACQASHLFGLGDRMCISPAIFKMQFIGVGEAFTTHVQVALIMGFIIAFPYILWEIWRFVSPGLHQEEKKNMAGIILICSLLFLFGVCFGYFIIAPFAINFLVTYTVANAEIIPTVASYINYMVMFTLPIGLLFELPVVVFFLTKMGMTTPQGMRNYRRYAFVVILIVAGVITPSPDVLSQMLVGVPLYALYEFSILVSAREYKKQLALMK